MKSIIFIDLKNALLLHKKATERFGDAAGLRDKNLLESALHQPQVTIFGKFACKDIYEMAAAYAYHVIKNHPFIDGNKRAGMLIALTFLETNDLKIETSQEDIYAIAIEIASSKVSKEEIAHFFKINAVVIKKKGS